MSDRAAVETWLTAQTPEVAAMSRRLCGLARAAAPDVAEHIKWNAPSFMVMGDDHITLGVERKGGVRVVLHRGARAKPDAGFVFEDRDGLAAWPSPERAVLQFRSLEEIDTQAKAIADLFQRWLAATR